MKTGITGIANGGKTVFLTSLLWQLAEMDSSAFFLGGKIHLHGFHALRDYCKIKEQFPFEKYRNSLTQNGVWPEKTTDYHRYACEFHRSDWKKTISRAKRLLHLKFSDKQRMEFFDFPGERIADAAIAAFEGYNKWCDHILQHYQNHSDYLTVVSPYLKLQNQIIEDNSIEHPEDKLIHAYKLALAGLIHGYKPMISPSTFLLGRNGDSAKPASDEALASERIVGVDAKHQFVPLTEEFRTAFPKLTKQMSSRFKTYRKNLVMPLFEEIGESESLIVLVDIPSLLAGGVGRYNDNRQIVLDLFDLLRPDSTLGAKLLRILTFWQKRLKRVAFVAAKADLVHPDDLKNNKLKSLLQQMTSQAKNMLPDVDFEWFVCSAVHSTNTSSKPNSITGQPVRNNPERKEMEFKVPSLPDTWPTDWSAGEFPFTNVFPKASKNLQIPPKHLGLNRLFSFLIG